MTLLASGSTNSKKLTFSRKAKLLMLAVAPVAALLAHPALAANQTWDPLTTGTGSDGIGNWDTSTVDWTGVSGDVVWTNDGTSTAVFGVSAPATVTINVANINAAGITFNQGYTVAANGADTLTLSGTAPVVTVAAGQSATIGAPIARTGGLSVAGNATGTLTLTGRKYLYREDRD